MHKAHSANHSPEPGLATSALKIAAFTVVGIGLAFAVYLIVFFTMVAAAKNENSYDRTEFDRSLVRTDFDGDGVENSEDNCIILPNGDQLDEDNNGLGDACDAQCPNQSLVSIYDELSAQEFDELFLIAGTAGPMPGTRSAVGTGPKEQPIMYGAFSSPVAPQNLLGFWVGKAFQTDEKGGVVYNRMLYGLIEFWPHDVYYGTSHWDGKPVINIVARYPFNGFPDEVRLLEKDVYLGYSLNHDDNNHAMVRWALDFRCPDHLDVPWSDTYVRKDLPAPL